ncbi:Phage terminase-like protein, large subunit [Klebsiella pneumoniae]|nr:Phage terminase-like protein, large subunit [Klebsiella pneumoniae]
MRGTILSTRQTGRKQIPAWGYVSVGTICAVWLKRRKSRWRARVGFFTKHLNIWVQGEKAWMDMARWENAVTTGTTPLQPTGQCGSALTFPNKIDIQLQLKSGLLQMAMFMSAPDSGYLKVGWKPVPSSQADLYRKWNLAGFLQFTDGDVVDHAVIKEETIEWARGDSLNELHTTRGVPLSLLCR